MWEIKPIRNKEIQAIKQMLELDLNQSEIARRLGLCRVSVCRTVNKIKQGKALKYEDKLTLDESVVYYDRLLKNINQTKNIKK